MPWQRVNRRIALGAHRPREVRGRGGEREGDGPLGVGHRRP
jgi:hypothetical protein